MRISDWSSDVCSSDLGARAARRHLAPGGREDACRLDDLVCRNADPGSGMIGCEGCDRCPQPLDRRQEAGAEICVVPTMGEDQVDHRRKQRGILARADLEMHVGAPRRLRPARIDDDDMGASRSAGQTSELQSLMRISYAVFCLKKTHTEK